jgi:MFS transporter, SP family, sugar:H+ symporter
MDTNTRGFFRNFNGRLLYTVSILMLSQINFGADISTFSSTQAMDAFEKRFGRYNPETDSYALNPVYLSLLNSLTYIGQVAGVLLGGYIGRKKGRKWSLYVMCFWAILSAALLVSAKSRAQLLIGRILNYIYIGQELVTVPVFQAEVVPPQVRGFVVATYQLGSIVSASCVENHRAC